MQNEIRRAKLSKKLMQTPKIEKEITDALQLVHSSFCRGLLNKRQTGVWTHYLLGCSTMELNQGNKDKIILYFENF